MHNYYRSIEETAWPVRQIENREYVQNVYDRFGVAVRVTLDCGHRCILTGEAVETKKEIHCKQCHETNKLS